VLKERDVVEMLRHYRHDWLNDLQLILGYAQLGKLDKVEQKITDIMERSEQERGFDQLHIPKSTIWLYQLNWRSESFYLHFQSLVDEYPIIIDDEALLAHIQEIFHILPFYQMEYKQYNGMFMLKKIKHQIHIYITFDNQWNNIDTLQEKLEDLSFIQNVTVDEQLKITWQET